MLPVSAFFFFLPVSLCVVFFFCVCVLFCGCSLVFFVFGFSQALQGAFTDVLEGTVKRDSFLYKWLDYLSFALR